MTISQAIQFMQYDKSNLFISLYSACRNANDYAIVASKQARYIRKKALASNTLKIFKAQLTEKELEIFDCIYQKNMPINDTTAQILGVTVRTLFRKVDRFELKFVRIFKGLERVVNMNKEQTNENK